MTPRRDWLFNFKNIEGGKVLMGNNQSYNITGIESIKFKMWDETFRTLDNVRQVPNLRRNLIFLGMLDSSGESYKSEKGILRVMKGSIVILKGILKQGLCVLQGETIMGNVTVSSVVDDDIEIWHGRPGHIGMKGLQELSRVF